MLTNKHTRAATIHRREIRHHKRHAPSSRLALERLEGRHLLAVVIVDTNSDDVDFGGGQQVSDLPGPDRVISLREALIATNNTPGADEVLFDTGGAFAIPRTIELTAGQLFVSDALAIFGPGADMLTVDALHGSRVWEIDNGNSGTFADVTLVGMTITGGRTTGDFENGGGILNFENLILADSRMRAVAPAEGSFPLTF